MIKIPNSTKETERTNTLAIVGFILSFLFPLAGLIISIIALNQIKASGENGKGFAIAGIVISAVFMVLGLLFMILWIGLFAAIANEASATEVATTVIP